MTHIPREAPYDTQRAFQEIIEELRTLKSKLSSVSDTTAKQSDIDDVRGELRKATQRPQTLDFQDTFRGSGRAHAIGYVPDPFPFAPLSADLRVLTENGRWEWILDGVLHVLPRGAAGTSIDQRIVNLFGSLAVLNGLSADSLHVREINADRVNTRVPACTLHRTADQTIGTGTDTVVNFDAKDDDTDGLHSLTVNNSRITLSRSGRWALGFAGRFAGNATGSRRCQILWNGAVIRAIANWETVTATVQDISTPVLCQRFVAGDFFEVRVFQSSGGDLALQNSAAFSPYFWAYWVSP